MNIPSFGEFKKNQNAFYAFITIIAVITLFKLLQKSQESQLKACSDEKNELKLKVDTLQSKLLIIVQKESIKESIK